MPSTLPQTPALRRALWTDAVVSATTGLLQLAATPALASWLGLPAALLMATGLFMLLYASALAWLARRASPPTAALATVVYGNVGWAAACVAIWLGGWVTPTGWGVAYLLLQADAVLVLAAWQGWAWWAARRAARTEAVSAARSHALT